MDAIEKKVKELISDQLSGGETPIENFQLSLSLQKDLMLDSLSAIDLMFSIEKAFNITFSDEDLLLHEEWMGTIGSLVEFVRRKTTPISE